MAAMRIRIKDEERKVLKALASLEGRTMTEIVSELLEQYIRTRKTQLRRSSQSREILAPMKLSESSFSERNNTEDDVYDTL
jgi:hypothetical protein